jgi:branched-chain amino acid transport system ATP-binding protein
VSALLEIAGARKAFGRLTVVAGVDLVAHGGETLGILGPNGAGKTTLFNLVTGDVRADGGRIVLDGEDVTALPPHLRCRRGIGRSYQVPRPFAGMTVYENLLVAATFGGALHECEAYAPCAEVLARTGLSAKANRLAGALTLLDRKRLELARALASRPKVLLLDEIAGGLTDHEAHELVALIRELRAERLAIVWIEHVMHAIMSAADRMIVLDAGAKIAEGAPREVVADPNVQRVYMGIEA